MLEPVNPILVIFSEEPPYAGLEDGPARRAFAFSCDDMNHTPLGAPAPRGDECLECQRYFGRPEPVQIQRGHEPYGRCLRV